ncbi:hypothetical protein AGOR_G00100260 [Albula goreensis]|uniref:Uncharacterized protein n=1 Tax=Albula goreensis TaxID=1534307 RepID=A0A8T3DPS5_9TELE|nr:hypothetical protein AGOR_G00100260 [Albula goreensis]
MREAGQLLQPNQSSYTVASIVRTFRGENRTERWPSIGGRWRLLTAEQETALVNMVVANNPIHLRDIQTQIVEDQVVFQEIDWIVQKNHIEEAGLNQTKRRKRRRNIIGRRAVKYKFLARGEATSPYEATSNRGILHRHVNVGPHNTSQLHQFLD